MLIFHTQFRRLTPLKGLDAFVRFSEKLFADEQFLNFHSPNLP